MIIDGSNIAQRIGNALDSVRKNIQKRIDDKQNNRAYKIMKSQWKIFHMMYEDLEKTKPYYMRGINEYLTQEQAIGIVFDEYPEFGQVWTAYQEIMKAMHNKDLSGFEDIITHYTIMGNDMDSAISTFAKKLIREFKTASPRTIQMDALKV
ncbi:hypothetical protein EQG49_06880 [Periweissella cryptocerci]|uniref:Transposase IS204/IS1001/IS1096/IS1165 DDE domain-containing protein n=1 Tax=Periweissella cryptocerci TaxID=2506420 RepID=A0A4P6YU19_9LACO|nr:hypothetical protein EQG49_06880 [Periweissella cryptocerci]